MTEEEWLFSTNLHELLSSHLPLAKSEVRQLRLLTIAFARSVMRLCQDRRVWEMLEVAERAIEGQVDDVTRSSTRRLMYHWYRQLEPKSSRCVASAVYYSLSKGTTLDLRQASVVANQATGWSPEEKVRQANLLRDIFGNPFRPVTFSPSWRTTTAIGVAQKMYDLRDFAAMPILADALQDAGCEDDAILSHCRGDGPHVRGCWVVDLVLGKS